jgi:Protein of unknown function (DUF3046)
MDEQFTTAYSRSWAADTVLSELGGRTVVTALEQGEAAKDVWRAVVAHLGLPAARR